MTIDVDFRDPQIYFPKELITSWDSPYEADRISDEKRTEIYQYIREFLVKKFGEDKISADI